jgi:hypothetical protein
MHAADSSEFWNHFGTWSLKPLHCGRIGFVTRLAISQLTIKQSPFCDWTQVANGFQLCSRVPLLASTCMLWGFKGLLGSCLVVLPPSQNICHFHFLYKMIIHFIKKLKL